MDKMEIYLPIPMPTWNRILAMHPMARIKLRDLIHKFVSLSITHGSDWPTSTDFLGKRQSTDLLVLEYLQTIRPSKSRKSDITKLKARWKAQQSQLKESEVSDE